MPAPCLYLDNNATTQPAPQVVESLHQTHQQLWANPSSVHRQGQTVRQHVELARHQLGQLIHCKESQLIFTSGGTESNNLAIRGITDIWTTPPGPGPGSSPTSSPAPNPPAPTMKLISTAVEHAAVRQPIEALAKYNPAISTTCLSIGSDGLVNLATLDDALTEAGQCNQRALVSLHWANNETGVIQPIQAIVQCCLAHRKQGHQVLLHVDATQAVGKIAVDVTAWPVDLLTLSAHKFHGPKAVGALYVRAGITLRCQNLGGSQEREKRGGTENAPGIIAMGVAAQLAQDWLEEKQGAQAGQAMRDQLEHDICQALPQTVVNAVNSPRLWNTTNMAFPKLQAEAILLGLSEKGLCASAGAACSSGSLEPSPILLAMGIARSQAHGSVRFSLSRFTTQDEIAQAVPIITQVVNKVTQSMAL